ncbi:hypothetical protein [Acetobacter senegalensis]|uniref:hypothetical protein n=1 Tax=Acetobacter senegalensis TaxID=446692 RepID=UPI002650D1F4|nr:hypothetical protein [Acetobacter senegalensis]MDN7353320.1 hypothetical protein [Acetobacter senegalensis]
MVEYIELSIDELMLDEDNPRLGSVNNQSAALEAIVKLSESHFRKLMISIKNNGLDPGDSLYVIDSDDGDDYIVLEGNRRLSSLMVLSNPDVIDGTNISETSKKSLLRAAAGFDRSKVEPIRCVKFDRREDANEWIYRRHTGGADGEGRIEWGPLEVQRFSGDRSILDIIDFIGRNAEYSVDEWESTKTVIESRKSSNLTRLLESAAGRKHLGISLLITDAGKIPMLASDPRWALKVLCRIIEDVRDSVVDSRDLNKASDIEKYLQELPENLQPQGDYSEKPRLFKDINLNEKASPVVPAPVPKKVTNKQKTRSVPKARVTLAPKRHSFKPPVSTKGQTLLREASSLDADKFTISSAFVLRGFVELAINDYMDDNGITKFEQKSNGQSIELDLSKKAEKVVQHIVAADSTKNADLRGFRSNILTKTSATSIQSLNGFVHNKFQIPTADALRSAWDCCVPVFVASYGSA